MSYMNLYSQSKACTKFVPIFLVINFFFECQNYDCVYLFVPYLSNVTVECHMQLSVNPSTFTLVPNPISWRVEFQHWQIICSL